MKNMLVSLPIMIMREGKWFVASCPPLDIATQGETEEEVKENMADLIQDYLSDKDTPKPEKLAELSSISFIQAKIPKGGENGKIKAVAD
ncbi:MAG: hypothetical protein V1776_02065 [Candidatus Diapherotrites archaeon]